MSTAIKHVILQWGPYKQIWSLYRDDMVRNGGMRSHMLNSSYC